MLGSASLKHSSPPTTDALPKRDESNITLHGRSVSPSKAPFQIMFFPAGVEAVALNVPSARSAAGASAVKAKENEETRRADVFNMRLRLGNVDWLFRVRSWQRRLRISATPNPAKVPNVMKL